MRNLANNMKNGAPGRVSNFGLYAEAMNSPQSKTRGRFNSQKYTKVAAMSTPVTLFKRSKRIQLQVFVDARTSVFACREVEHTEAEGQRTTKTGREVQPAPPISTNTTPLHKGLSFKVSLGMTLGKVPRFGPRHSSAPRSPFLPSNLRTAPTLEPGWASLQSAESPDPSPHRVLLRRIPL